MIDVMRQVQTKVKKSSPLPPKPKNEDKLASSHAQDANDEQACFCCAKPDCQWPRCPKKDTLPIKKWHKQHLAPAYLVKRQEKAERKGARKDKQHH